MRGRAWLVAAASVLALGLSGCDVDEANQVRDGIGTVQDGLGDVQKGLGDVAGKAEVCGRALGFYDLTPELNWEQISSSAGERAQELQNLAERTENADVRDALSGMADAYVELEQRKVDRMRDVQEWVESNTERFSDLRQACL